MNKKIVKWFLAALCGVLAACAVITVNVYFPEKDVKQAYESLDDMLLKQGEDAAKPAAGQPDEGAPKEGQPPGSEPSGTQPPGGDGSKPPEVKPQSSLNGEGFGFSLVAAAYAAAEIADELAVEMSSMPEVLNAYDQISASIPQLRGLRDSGAIGENKQGLLTIRDPAKMEGKEAVVKTVNESRKAVITGMARAILKVNKQPETKAAMNQVLGKAAAMFADVRREKAKPGWWIELPNGRWVQK